MAWQPIETAPKDGTPVLIFDGVMQCVATMGLCWGSENREWTCVGASGYECDNDFCPPTHWMPLPAEPTQGDGE